MSNKDSNIVFYTDGGCPKNGAVLSPGGWGVYVITNAKTEQQEEHFLFGSILKATNNIAELRGVIEALRYAREKNWMTPTFNVDSKYVLNGIAGGIERWAKDNWLREDGSPRPNKELWIELKDELIGFEKAKWKWVKGHSGVTGNEHADSLATKGCVVAGSGMELPREVTVTKTPVTNKPKPKPKKESHNRILSGPRWYFDSKSELRKTDDGRCIIYTGAHGKKDSFIGRKSHESLHSVSFIREMDPVMQYVHEQHLANNSHNLGTVGYCKFDALTSKDRYNEILTNIRNEETKDKLQFLPATDWVGLTTMDGTPITVDATPPILAFEYIDELFILENVLLKYQSEKRFVVTDVTDRFYITEQVKKRKEMVDKTTMVSDINTATKTINLDVKTPKGETVDLMLTLGHSLPTRNTFSALASSSPKVKVVTWPEGSKAFRFAVITELEEDISIWSAYYANLRFVN